MRGEASTSSQEDCPVHGRQAREATTPTRQQQIDALVAMTDSQIDTSDIPETKDWSGAEQGKFQQATAPNPMPLIDAQATAPPANWTLHPLLGSAAPLDGDWEAQLRALLLSVREKLYCPDGGFTDGDLDRLVDAITPLLARARQEAAQRILVLEKALSDLVTWPGSGAKCDRQGDNCPLCRARVALSGSTKP
jgi:hypothetical protein